jgi:plastocyanin
MVRRAASVVVVGAALAVAGTAQAATWHVAAGEQSRPPAGTPKQATLDVFMPAKLAINAGDKVKFTSATFHTATYLGKLKPPPLFVPDPAKKTYAGIVDEAGQPFFFDALHRFIYNGQAFAPFGGTTVAGKAPVSSGVLSPRGPKAPPASATFTFPKAGTYRLICNVHPKMTVDVVVKAAGAPVSASPAQVEAQILREQADGWKEARAAAASAHPRKNEVYAGVGNAATILGFYPKVLKVKAGTTVLFVNRSPREVHNEAFGPPKWIAKFQRQTDLLPMGPKLIPLPHGAAVRFTKPGKYHYFCLIHGPDMSGDIVVTS